MIPSKLLSLCFYPVIIKFNGNDSIFREAGSGLRLYDSRSSPI
jgi:hypothetical protein